MVEEAERHRAEDKETERKAEARSDLENYLYRWAVRYMGQAVQQYSRAVRVRCIWRQHGLLENGMYRGAAR